MAYPEYYQILGIAPDASPEEIKQAYIRLVKMYHPDTHQGDPAAEEKLKKINEAYDTLKDLAKRAEYDYYGTAEEEIPFEADVPATSPQPYENSAPYTTEKSSNISPQKSKRKYIFAKLFALSLLLFLAFFIYAQRDLKYPRNIFLMLRNSSQTLFDIGSTVTHAGIQKFNNLSYVKNAKTDLAFYAVQNNKFYLLMSALTVCPPDAVNNQNHGRSLLMEAKDGKIIELLISAGANVNLKDDEGETALTLAVRRNDALAAELLLQAGADANYTLPNGKTPLQLAIDNNDTVMMTILQGHGAKLPSHQDAP